MQKIIFFKLNTVNNLLTNWIRSFCANIIHLSLVIFCIIFLAGCSQQKDKVSEKVKYKIPEQFKEEMYEKYKFCYGHSRELYFKCIGPVFEKSFSDEEHFDLILKAAIIGEYTKNSNQPLLESDDFIKTFSKEDEQFLKPSGLYFDTTMNTFIYGCCSSPNFSKIVSNNKQDWDATAKPGGLYKSASQFCEIGVLGKLSAIMSSLKGNNSSPSTCEGIYDQMMAKAKIFAEIEDKEYLIKQIAAMYADTDPWGEFNKFNKVLHSKNHLRNIDIDDVESRLQAEEEHMKLIERKQQEYDQKRISFNQNCRKKIFSTPILKKYFESFCERHKKDKLLSIEKLNFWGADTITKIEEELEIKLLKKAEEN